MAFRRTQQQQQSKRQSKQQSKGRFAAFGRDEIFETYVEWRQASANLSEIYERWVHAPPEEVEHSFHAYNAALDQEDAAARTYAEVLADGERRLGWAA